ncbi:alpha-L-rhamnosidase C-terminal domain-containing protein [Streptomyces sp. BH104]|uniref:alpha-L-rhamnosidase C-terminal domain-containing protein n=1 Tax=Streptomyces sp. BH104 TaxID=3410407 RepID=UPI003BB80408
MGARGTFDSPRGFIEVEWRTQATELTLDVHVPPTSTATVVLPGGEDLVVGPGRSHITRQRGAQGCRTGGTN